MKKIFAKFPALLLTMIVGIIASPSAFGAVTIVIRNVDQGAVGFNDTTPAAPVGGNSGTTLGQQRLKAFQLAADLWGATLPNGPTITVQASWAPLTCTTTTAVLGSAGASSRLRDFPGAPFAGTWYSVALANAISGVYLNGTSPEISAQFNVNIGNSGCLSGTHWYLGLDGNHGSDIDLVTVLIHEFAHGLGFQTFTNANTGAQASGFPSIYDRFLLDNTTNKTWAQMTDAERAASALNTGKLVWNGAQATSDAHTVLSSSPRLRINPPSSIAGSYQVGTADFGPSLTSSGVTANVGQASPTDGCTAITSASVSGKIALIDRGNCNFVSKVKNAQNAGAVGVIIADNTTGNPPPGMTGTDSTIIIPTVSITQADGNTIKAQLSSGVNATLLLDSSVASGADSSGHPLLFTPNPFQSGSSVSHWDTSAFPNQLMEPNISSDLSHSVTLPQDLTFSLLKDIGWSAASTAPPPPPPPPPANDNFANAQAIAGCTGSVNGTNAGATAETGEPSHDPGGSVGGGSVWYQWQAPSSGSVTITTAGSPYDTVLAIYTGTSMSNLTVVLLPDGKTPAKSDDVDSNDNTSTITFNATAGTVYKIAVDGWGGESGSIKLNWTEANCTQATTTVQLSQNSYAVNEGAGSASVAVTRTDTTTAATINYATSDTAALTNCNVTGTGIASSRCDYATSIGTLRFAAGESSKTISIPIVDDNFTEGAESFTVTLSSPVGASLGSIQAATVTITDNANTAGNPADQSAFFVRQHYIDFLGREPDPAGFQGWQNSLNNCKAGDTTCDRIEVSSGFFRSTEFQERGYFVYRFYSVSLGRKPDYAEFMPDLAKVSGFLTDAEKEANKVAFVDEFMTRTAFRNKYDALTTPTAYVDALLNTAGLLTHPSRAGWIAGLQNNSLTRAQVLRQLAESAEAYSKFYNEAFVVMQYFGYLRRDPDAAYLDWIKSMNQNNDYRVMINGFMNSAEYRQRFGP
ncbi:MAG: hypothetical protein QOJ02_487 [Acidobacteriota bacterium]|jgi:hypothetical protein|nr:hypothetical protein [Acidobacteriota bacterium]